MKRLSSEQIEFLKKEFGIVSINYNDPKIIEDIRLKCFDIETKECCDRLNRGENNSSIGERGDMAVTIIDDLEDIAKTN